MALTTTQSQATPAPNINNPSPNASINPGVGAPSDDATINASIQSIQAGTSFDNTIVPQPNILDDYNNYTYSITWYLMSSDALRRFQTGDTTVLSGQTIIMQSGGINNAQRNPYFDVDFYFDDLKLKSVLAGSGTMSPTNVVELEFTVIEPNGITLVPRLIAAINGKLGAGGQEKDQNVSAQNFMMAVRFYGYDEEGNLVQVGRSIAGQNNYALVEKFIPFQLTEITYKVQTKLTEYHIKGTISAFQVSLGENQNSIPYNVEVSGLTVQEVLSSGTSVTTNSNPAAAAPPIPRPGSQGQTPKNTVRSGLVTALNQYQKELVSRGVYNYANEYVIEFVDQEIANAKVTVKDGRTKGTGMPLRGTAPDLRDPRRQAMDPTVRLIDYTAGQQITQIIDQTIRNSTYISNQSNTLISETTGKVNPNAGAQPLTWYKINMQAIPKQYDTKRNDYAYTIRYVISKYGIQNLESPYFKRAEFNGVHKQYYYWFTGLNTQVLNYEQTYNSQATLIIGNQGDTGTSVTNSAYKQLYSPRAGESSQGATGRTNDIAANAADFLYHKADLAELTLQVVGDPAWIQQGEVVSLPNASEWKYGAFLADGTINFDSQQVLLEVSINAPTDYNLATGLMDPDTRIDGVITNVGLTNQPHQRYVYRVTQVMSDFNKGKFTQTITGVLMHELSIDRFNQIQENIGTKSSLAVTNQTPTRVSLTNNQLALNSSQPLNATGLPVPNATADNIVIASGGSINLNPLNILQNLPASQPTSNGLVTNLPSTDTITVTNGNTQAINRDT